MGGGIENVDGKVKESLLAQEKVTIAGTYVQRGSQGFPSITT